MSHLYNPGVSTAWIQKTLSLQNSRLSIYSTSYSVLHPLSSHFHWAHVLNGWRILVCPCFGVLNIMPLISSPCLFIYHLYSLLDDTKFVKIRGGISTGENFCLSCRTWITFYGVMRNVVIFERCNWIE